MDVTEKSLKYIFPPKFVILVFLLQNTNSKDVHTYLKVFVNQKS